MWSVIKKEQKEEATFTLIRWWKILKVGDTQKTNLIVNLESISLYLPSNSHDISYCPFELNYRLVSDIGLHYLSHLSFLFPSRLLSLSVSEFKIYLFRNLPSFFLSPSLSVFLSQRPLWGWNNSILYHTVFFFVVLLFQCHFTIL